jgi:hypothetical protein
MKVKQIRNLLASLSQIQAKSGASDASAVFEKLASLMRPYDHEEFSEFVARVKRLQNRS